MNGGAEKSSGDGEVTFTIAQTGAFHAPVLSALHEACFPRGWDEAAFATLLAAPGVFATIARAADGTPLGLLMVRAVADEAEILTLGVLPEARRRGIARALLTDGLERLAARGVGEIWLEVAASNAAARALYTGLGFIGTGLRVGYYTTESGAREDALLMRLAPPPARGDIEA